MFYSWASFKAIQLFMGDFFKITDGMFHSIYFTCQSGKYGKLSVCYIRADQSGFFTTFFSQLVTVTKLPIGVVGVFNCSVSKASQE